MNASNRVFALGAIATVSGAAALATRKQGGWVHLLSLGVSSLAAGASVAAYQRGDTAGDLSGDMSRREEADSLFYEDAVEKAQQSGYHELKVSPLLADKMEKGLLAAAADAPSVAVYRRPGQGMSPTVFVLTTTPRNIAGAKRVNAAEAAPKRYDPTKPPSIVNLIRIPTVVRRRGEPLPPAASPAAAPAAAKAAFQGAGGWAYYRADNGAIVVLKDPRPGQPMAGKTVAPGSTAWKAIDAEMRAAGR